MRANGTVLRMVTFIVIPSAHWLHELGFARHSVCHGPVLIVLRSACNRTAVSRRMQVPYASNHTSQRHFAPLPAIYYTGTVLCSSIGGHLLLPKSDVSEIKLRSKLICLTSFGVTRLDTAVKRAHTKCAWPKVNKLPHRCVFLQ